MKNIFLTLILIIAFTSCKTANNYTFQEVIDYANEINIPKRDLFYIDADSLKKAYSGEKISLQNHGIKVMDFKLNVLKTKEGKCSVKKLKSISTLDSLEIDLTENNKFIKIYPNLTNRLKENKFTILCIWSKYYTKNVTLENMELALENNNKYNNCQILYLNADIYTELYSKLKK